MMLEINMRINNDESLCSYIHNLIFALFTICNKALPNIYPKEIYIVDQIKLLIASKIINLALFTLLMPTIKIVTVLKPYRNLILNIANVSCLSKISKDF